MFPPSSVLFSHSGRSGGVDMTGKDFNKRHDKRAIFVAWLMKVQRSSPSLLQTFLRQCFSSGNTFPVFFRASPLILDLIHAHTLSTWFSFTFTFRAFSKRFYQKRLDSGSYTHSHTDGGVDHVRRQPARQEQSGGGALLWDYSALS